MSPIAFIFLIISSIIIWGGLIASVLYLNMKPEVEHFPEGGTDPERD